MPQASGFSPKRVNDSGLAGRRKRPCRLRAQSGLSSRGSRSRRCLGSGCFRGFLRSRLLGCFLGCWLLGSRLLRYSSFLCRGFLGGYFLRSDLLGWRRFLRSSLLRRCGLLRSDLLCRYFFRWCRLLGRSSFLGSNLLRCYLLRWCRLLGRRSFLSCYFLRWCRFLCGSGLFCGRFFCSCHYFLLDQFTKSTSCKLESMKRSMVLGKSPAP